MAYQGQQVLDDDCASFVPRKVRLIGRAGLADAESDREELIPTKRMGKRGAGGCVRNGSFDWTSEETIEITGQRSTGTMILISGGRRLSYLFGAPCSASRFSLARPVYAAAWLPL